MSDKVTKSELLNRVAALETELGRTRHYMEVAHKARDRADKRTAAANKRNGELQKALRKSEWERRKLQLQIDGDVFAVRRLKVLQNQLSLIRDVATTPTDDWVAKSADVPIDQLLTRGH